MGSMVWDHFDCVDDEILAKQSKRRRLDVREFKINSCSHRLKGTVDEDYLTFLNLLNQYCESRHFERADGYNRDEEEDLDPDYKKFLEKMKEDGNSYLLEVGINNKTILKYESEGGPDDECEPETIRKSRKVPETEKAVKDLDPDYKTFLEKMKEDGNSYLLKVGINNKTISKYGSEGGLDDQCEPVTIRKSRKVPETEKAAKDLRNLLSKDKMETGKSPRCVVSKAMRGSRQSMGNVVGKERRNLVMGKDLKTKSVNNDSGNPDGHSSQNPTPKADHLFGIEVDESYLTFLNVFRWEGDSLVFPDPDGKQLMYEGYDGEDSSDSEIFITSNATDFNKGNYNPFQTSKLVDSLMEEDGRQFLENPNASKCSEFRLKLMGKLREPYDQKEYEKLWQIINDQTLKDGRHRDLRGSAALKSYSKDECNPSYLEYHKSLKRKIDAVKSDRRKVLNLLRGFFFWLENLVYEDAFHPWLDPSCLAVLPRNR